MNQASAPGNCQWISLTPTKNEAWIIRQFLAASQFWADRTIVADQGSTDGTVETLQRTAGVEVVINDSPVFDEAHRQNILINQARRKAGQRILIALDADEALSANCLNSPEWEQIARAQPGTILRFRWVNILPGFEKAWIPPNLIPCGFVDDGAEHRPTRIHSTRIPTPPNAPVLDLKDIVVLHFQYVAWDRVVSKQRWYQAWEHLNFPEKRPLDIFRQYNHMHGSWNRDEIHPVRPEWLAAYAHQGIDYHTLKSEPMMWWDREIVSLISQHGPERFRKIALWSKDWSQLAQQLGVPGTDFNDPRTMTEKLAHRILAASQSRRGSWPIRAFEHLLRKSGW